MWQQIARAEWPFWALDVSSLWKHKTGHWLTNKENERSSLWELRSPDGLVLTNQLDLPFSEGLKGAPTVWATRELADRKERARVRS